MKRILPLCLVVFILLGYMFPVQPVKADQGTEVTFTDAQLSQIGAWALSNNLITGITDEYDFGNLPIRAPMTPADFLIALGESIVTKDPTPLINFGYNVAEDVVNQLKADLNDLWEGAKDFFYELFFGSPQSTLSIDDFIQPSLQFGLDQLDKVLATQGDGDVPALPSDYAWINNINELYFGGTSFWSMTTFETGSGDTITPSNDLHNYTYFIKSYSAYSGSPHLPNNNSNSTYCSVDISSFAPKISIYYDSSSNTASYSSYQQSNIASNSYLDSYVTFQYICFFNNPNKLSLSQKDRFTPSFQTLFDGINSAMNYFYSHFFNVNLYVDDVLWVGGNPALPPISSGQLTYPNGEPAVREFPTGTQIDWDELYNRIYQAIVDGLVLDFSDIDDCIVDVNGQSAVASLRLVRTDYDKLYIEQYGNDITLPYFPKTLTTGEAQAVVGGTVGNIISPYNPSNPALNEDSVIPSDIARVLYIGVFLTLFACIINRLLE